MKRAPPPESVWWLEGRVATGPPFMVAGSLVESLEELAGWQRDAGLTPLKPVWLRTSSGSAQQPAGKRAA